MKITCYLILLFAIISCNQAPSTEEVNKLFADIHSTLMNRDNSFEVNDAKVAEMLNSKQQTVNPLTIEISQFNDMLKYNTFRRSEALKSWIMPRLKELSYSENGAAARIYIMSFNNDKNIKPKQEDYSAIIKAPGFVSVLNDELLSQHFFRSMNYLRLPQQLVQLKEELENTVSNQPLNTTALHAIAGFYKSLLSSKVDKKDTKSLHTYLVNNYTSLPDSLKTTKVKEQIEFLNTNYAKGELVGNLAPELDFIWSSSKQQISKLSDLKGKVVVLDFWATWCGPCVRSFPNVRALKERYKDYPVVILGVTSVQGRHISFSGDKRETISTEGDTEKEFSLMKEFMKDMDMTWDVAFSSQRVFNNEYGVNGIPYVAIVDAQGIIRYSHLSPSAAPHHEAEKIDALLAEAGLKAPKKPMEKVNYIQ
ncbi:MAG: TlpA family protein disulfide reductase [Marinifilaceae bacterium]